MCSGFYFSVKSSVTRLGVLFSFKNLALTLAWHLVVSDSGKSEMVSSERMAHSCSCLWTTHLMFIGLMLSVIDCCCR